MTSDRDLLAIEIETQWIADERGRLLHTRESRSKPAPAAVLAGGVDGIFVAFGRGVPEETAERAREAVAEGGATEAAVVRVRALLEAAGPVEVASGPCYILPDGLTVPPCVRVLRSDAGNGPLVRAKVGRPENWDEDEWRELLAGEMGPWAMIAEGGEMVSLCHSARLGPRGAEAGVWTNPEARGRGLAAVVTAAWATSPALGERVRFYSTSAENEASQRVAAKLGAREIGWLWRIGAEH